MRLTKMHRAAIQKTDVLFGLMDPSEGFVGTTAPYTLSNGSSSRKVGRLFWLAPMRRPYHWSSFTAACAMCSSGALTN